MELGSGETSRNLASASHLGAAMKNIPSYKSGSLIRNNGSFQVRKNQKPDCSKCRKKSKYIKFLINNYIWRKRKGEKICQPKFS